MKKVNIILIIFLFTSFTLHASNTGDSISFRPGDKAPGLDIIAWIKGEAVGTFQKNQIYIIEFTELYCVPCRKSFPYLSQLSEQFKGRINFLSIFIWSNDKNKPGDLNYIDKTKYVVETMGDKIKFAVGIDNPLQTTASSWMEKSGNDGVPTVFIVDGAGKLAWVGRPEELNAVVIGQVTGQTLDVAATATTHEREKKQLDESLTVIRQLRNTDSDRASRLMDSVIVLYPGLQFLFNVKYQVLAGVNDTKANAWLQTLLDNDKLLHFDWYHLSCDILLKQKDIDDRLALAVADRAIRESEDKVLEAHAIDIKGQLLYKAGQFRQAIKTEIRAINVYRESGMKDDTGYFEAQLNFFRQYAAVKK